MHKTWGPIFLLIMALVGGCTNSIVPPGQVADPVTVYLLDHGRTPSLVLPVDDDGSMMRVAYGDWTWYALGRTGLLEAMNALLWPSQGALGLERFHATADDPASIRAAASVASEQVYALRVERSAVQRLAARIEALHAAQADRLVHSDFGGLTFARDPRRYWLFHNSNHVTSEWLAELGCDVRGLRMYSSWRVEE